jgi:hypothetical protein
MRVLVKAEAAAGLRRQLHHNAARREILLQRLPPEGLSRRQVIRRNRSLAWLAAARHMSAMSTTAKTPKPLRMSRKAELVPEARLEEWYALAIQRRSRRRNW